jgi:hypothetical protein
MTEYSALINRFTSLPNDTDTGNNPNTNHITTIKLALPVLDHATGKILAHCQLCTHPDYKVTWDRLYADELGRLCQGIESHPTNKQHKCIKGTNTLWPINFRDIPQEHRGDISHTRVIICKVRPMKADPNRTQITIGGNKIAYLGDCGTKTGLL